MFIKQSSYKAATVTFLALSVAAALSACGTESGPIPRLAGDNHAQLSDDLTSAVAQAVDGDEKTVALTDISRGSYELIQFSYDLTLLDKQRGQVNATYTHEFGAPGTFRNKDRVSIDEPMLPAGMGYSATLPLALPMRIESSGHASTLMDFNFYEPNFYHYPSDPSPSWNWSNHKNASRGYSLLAVLKNDLERKTRSNRSFYVGTLPNFSETYGTVAAWVRALSENLIQVRVTFMRENQIVALSVSYLRKIDSPEPTTKKPARPRRPRTPRR